MCFAPNLQKTKYVVCDTFVLQWLLFFVSAQPFLKLVFLGIFISLPIPNFILLFLPPILKEVFCIPIEVMKKVVHEMNCSEMIIGYGMTETSPIITLSDTDDPIEKQVASVGRVFPHVEAKIIDDEGRIVAPGVTGELLARGYNVMQGYWDDSERSAEAIDRAGWMHTGDLATMDSDGFFNIVGRVKDMVIRGGENIYPREIEEYLYRHPNISDVQVFGVPDDKFVEELCAWITVVDGATLDEAAVREFCQGQIAHYKIPRYIRFVDSFPMTVTGKIQKFVMREQMITELGLTVKASA